MSRRTGGGPQAVLSEQSNRTVGDEALSMNIAAGRAVGEVVRTTLGPRGMDKMLVDSSGNVAVTNDGATLLEDIEIDHPTADMVVDVARTQEEEVGDGTTSAVVLAGELLAEAEDLTDDGVHPGTVVAGYRQAERLARDALADLAVAVDPEDRETLERIAATALTGKGAGRARELLAEIVVEGVTTAVRDDGTVEQDAIDVRKFHGQSMGESRFVRGATLAKKPLHPDMPERIEDARVLVYEGEIERSELETDLAATAPSPEAVEEFADRERAELREVVERMEAVGADVVLVDGAIDDYAQQQFARRDMLAFRRIEDDERQRVALATGADRVSDFDALTADDLGEAGLVERTRVRETRLTRAARPEQVYHFRETAGAGLGTIWLRGATRPVVEEVERAIEDAIDVVSVAIEHGTVLPGGGAPEAELALRLREAASGVEGREQLAVQSFADALESIPRTLAETAGHDTIDALVELSARHDAGETSAGLDADSGEPVDALEAGIVEPHRVKESAVETATDAATLILRIDDVVAAGDLAVGDDEDEEPDLSGY